ncbi:MAG: hypothetical protein M3Q65_18350 [Chloroflexota bacterium]|nr:hypothetical protein [Chloroflexota bacterium]
MRRRSFVGGAGRCSTSCSCRCTEILAERERLVFDWCRRQRLPVAFVLAGAYTGPALGYRGPAEYRARCNLQAA